jgi:hypothetical protein
MSGCNKAADDGDSAGALGYVLDGFTIAGDEGGLFDEIARRIAANGEFGKKNQLGAGLAGALGEIDDFRGVAVEIPDGRIDLSQRNDHVFSLNVKGYGAKRQAAGGGEECDKRGRTNLLALRRFEVTYWVYDVDF